LNKLPKQLEASRDPRAPANNQVRLPFVSLTKVKAMRYWVHAQCYIGVDAPNVDNFDVHIITETLPRMQADKDYMKATEDTDIRKAEKLCNLVKWTKFWELLITYLGRVKSATLTPLLYLVREHDVVTQEQLDAVYGSVQERLIATTALSGLHFELDNCTLYN
jgi:hypothetical protein